MSKTCEHNYTTKEYQTEERVRTYAGMDLNGVKYDIATIKPTKVIIFCTKCGDAKEEPK